ncbi:sugar phosphate nucleotidyltransferase [Aeromonas aquatica]
MQAIVVTAGKGTRLWPFTEIRSKSMLAVSNMPIVYWLQQALAAAGVNEMAILADEHEGQFAQFFHHNKAASATSLHSVAGAQDIVEALLAYQQRNPVTDAVLVIPGDCLIEAEDLERLVNSPSANAVLLRKLRTEERSDRLCFNAEQDFKLLAHPRREGFDCEIVAYKLSADFFSAALPYTTDIYDHVQVGMMPSSEKFLESALAGWAQQVTVDFIHCDQPSFNLDYPWNILEVNGYLNRQRCQQLSASEIAPSATVSSRAVIRGHIKIGQHSHIGDGVIFQGNAIVGDHCQITDGAIIGENVVIGNGVTIKEYCKLADETTVGNQAIIGHCAELAGVIFESTYLYHNCEIAGVLGRNVDIGAGTTFGTLRYDDAKTSHLINQKRVTPHHYSNVVYMGDFTRTGVNTVIMPGVKVGCRSVVGSNVVLADDLPDERIIQVEQTLITKPWGSQRYGFNR